MSSLADTALQAEAHRQGDVLAAIWQRPGASLPCPAGVVLPPGCNRPLGPYISHAQAQSAQVLRNAYPTLEPMIGPEALAVLAWRLWQHAPPTLGDLNRWGGGLPQLIEHTPELAPWPFLADVARLDWACHEALGAADAVADAVTLQRLGDTAPEHLAIRLRPDVRVLHSAWPVHRLWLAHQPGSDQDAAMVIQQALVAGSGPGESVVVWRTHWQAQCTSLSAEQARWMSALCAQGIEGQDLLSLLDAQGPDFDFTEWLTLALHEGWLWRVELRNP